MIYRALIFEPCSKKYIYHELQNRVFIIILLIRHIYFILILMSAKFKMPDTLSLEYLISE